MFFCASLLFLGQTERACVENRSPSLRTFGNPVSSGEEGGPCSLVPDVPFQRMKDL